MSDIRRDRTTTSVPTSLRLSLRARLRRWSAVTLAVLSVVAAALVANPAPASAAVYGTAMVQTQRMTGPALPPQNTQAGWYSRGQRLTLVCHARGQSVRGYYSPYLPNGGWDNLWYKVSDGYWVADVDINTGSNDPVVGACSSSSSSGFRLPFASGYSARITQGPGGSYSHTDAYNRHAVDFGVASGTRIVASGSGRIYFEGWATGGAGIQVLIDHGNNRCTQYAHLSRTVIDRGQSVTRGQTIGYSGATGAASGAHLHWNMVNCSTQTSREVVNTLERGTSYPAGTTVTSRNG